jgi:hypothetical protein
VTGVTRAGDPPDDLDTRAMLLEILLLGVPLLLALLASAAALRATHVRRVVCIRSSASEETALYTRLTRKRLCTPSAGRVPGPRNLTARGRGPH